MTLGIAVAFGQGKVTFDNSAGFGGTNYSEAGVRFEVVMPNPGVYDQIGISGPITFPSNIPYNPTPYMGFTRFYSANDYVSLSLTSGSVFGLISVQLADPNSPSAAMLPITFLGYKMDGSTVSDTFTTPGNGANTLLYYHFTLDFASGLTSVKINASRWAMDNLVFAVPEPGTVSIILASLMILALSRRRAK